MPKQVVLGGAGGRNLLISLNVRGHALLAGIQDRTRTPWLCPFLLPTEVPHGSKMAASSPRVTPTRFKSREEKVCSLNRLSKSHSLILTGSYALPRPIREAREYRYSDWPGLNHMGAVVPGIPPAPFKLKGRWAFPEKNGVLLALERVNRYWAAGAQAAPIWPPVGYGTAFLGGGMRSH